MCMNLSALPFLAGSATEAHVCVHLLLWTGEDLWCKRRTTHFAVQGQSFTKEKNHLLPSCFRLLNICRLPPPSG